MQHDFSNKNHVMLIVASYTLSSNEKKRFYKCLKNNKVVDGYSSNMINLVSLKDCELQVLKSHDCHVLMQYSDCVFLWFHMCYYCWCNQMGPNEKKKKKKHMVETMCLLKKCFPPSFFDIMILLTIHVVHKIRLYGLVYLRWMYPFERNMKTLQGYVCNRNCVEGCIEESHIVEETFEFYADYLSNM